MLFCKCFQATVFHQINKIRQLWKITGNAVIITDSTGLRVIGIYDFKVCKTCHCVSLPRNETAVLALNDNLSVIHELFNSLHGNKQFHRIVERSLYNTIGFLFGILTPAHIDVIAQKMSIIRTVRDFRFLIRQFQFKLFCCE